MIYIKQFQPRILALIILVVVLYLALQTLFYRVQYEEQSDAVEIALDYGDLLKVAALSDIDSISLLEQARMAGLTTIVLLDDHALNIDSQLEDYLQMSNMLVALQLSNDSRYIERGVLDVLANAVTLPHLNLIFFAGYEALGWPNQVQLVADALEYIKLPVGYVEMLGEQKGLDVIVTTTHFCMVRIHPGYPYENLDDMVRSVRERGVRFAFLKPFKNMGLEEDAVSNEQAAKTMLSWISELKSEINNSGYRLGEAVVLPYLDISHPVIDTYFQAGIAIAALFLADLLPFGVKPRRILQGLIATVCVLLSILFVSGLFSLGIRDGYALLGAMVFPAIGLIRYISQKVEDDADTDSAKPPWRIGLQALIESSFITITGAIIVNAMLSSTPYLLGWQLFRGVKIALVAPPLIVMLSLLYKEYKVNISSKAGDPVSPRGARRLLLTVGSGIVVVFYLLRSGNDVNSISSLESMFRVNLERLLGVRPRTKEFLAGHPATMLLGWSAARNYSELTPFLLLLAAIAQASIFNTFIHLHVPVLIGVRRTLWGLALGEIIGLVVLALLWHLPNRSSNN